MEITLAPSWFKALMRGPFGLDLMEASPVSTAPSVRDAIAEKSRRVVPELRTLITSSGS